MSSAQAPIITPREIAEGLVAEIQTARQKRLEREVAEPYARNNPIASDIDPGSCLRRQVLHIVKPMEAAPFTPFQQARFEVGKLVEREATREFLGLGFEVYHQQIRFELRSRRTKTRCLSGKIDGKIEALAEIPFEVKGLHPALYEGVHSVQDLLESRWYRKYVFQMQAYLLGNGLDVGFFLLVDKASGDWKTIVVEIDYDLGERIWSFAEDVVDAVEHYRTTDLEGSGKAELPPFTEKKEQCLDCPFYRRSCHPEIQEEGVVLWESGELEHYLRERADVEAEGRRFDSLDSKIKKWLKDFESDPRLKGKPVVMVGEFLIEFEERHRKAYSVEAADYRQVAIKRLSKDSKVVNLMDALKESIAVEKGAVITLGPWEKLEAPVPEATT